MKNPTVVIGITGGIAAIKIPELIRMLVAQQITVLPIMTASAQRIVESETIRKVSNHEVYTTLFPEEYSTATVLKEKKVDHIAVADSADLVVIVPATANCMAKMAFGLADDFLTTTVLATRSPVLLCPSMNSHMWNHMTVQNNLIRLKDLGYSILMPESGSLACGYEGIGRLPAIEIIFQEIIQRVRTRKVLTGKKVLVTSGGTQEPIDDVRVITNKSSGVMGASIADACVEAGASVTYLHAKNAVLPRHSMSHVPFVTTEDLDTLLSTHVPNHDIIFHTAAVSDFVLTKQSGKISSLNAHTLHLTPREKLYQHIKQLNQKIQLITFKAEGDMAESVWKEKLMTLLDQSPIDVVIGNPINKKNQGFSSLYNEVYICRRDKRFLSIPLAPKRDIARNIITFLYSET